MRVLFCALRVFACGQINCGCRGWGRKFQLHFLSAPFASPWLNFPGVPAGPAAQRLARLEGIGLNLCPCVEINLVDGFMCGSGFETDYLF